MSFRAPGLLSVVFFAAACSGGGGGFTINSLNAEAIAAEVIATTDFFSQAAAAVEGLSAAIDPAAPAIACSAGTLNVTPTDAAPAGPSSGDTALFAFDACVVDLLGATYTLSGDVLLDATRVTGPWPGASSTLELDVMATGLVMDTFLVDGSFHYDHTISGTNATLSELTGTSLYVDGVAPGPMSSYHWTDYRFEGGFDPGTSAYSLDFDGMALDSASGVRFEYDTRIAFVGIGSSDPFDGRLDVRAPNGSFMRIQVIDANTVELRIDSDGNGSTETTITTSWTALRQ